MYCDHDLLPQWYKGYTRTLVGQCVKRKLSGHGAQMNNNEYIDQAITVSTIVKNVIEFLDSCVKFELTL